MAGQGRAAGVLDGVDLAAVLPPGLLPHGAATVQLVEARRLAPSFSSVAYAREVCRRATEAWQVGEVAEDLSTVVSELVANALDHGLGLEVGRPAHAAGVVAAVAAAGRSPIELRLVRTVDRVVCLVSDPAPEPPRRLAPDAVRESGRGLQLIDSLSLEWGWAPLAAVGGSGKVVWAALATR